MRGYQLIINEQKIVICVRRDNKRGRSLTWEKMPIFRSEFDRKGMVPLSYIHYLMFFDYMS